MTGTTIGSYTTVAVRLTAASQNPVSVTSTGSIVTTGSYAIYASAVSNWSITNMGVISGQTSSQGFGGGVGIDLVGTGTIGNGSVSDTAASIFGNYYGIECGQAVTVANYGTITGLVRIGVGAFGGSITNGSTADTHALIVGGELGVSLRGTGSVVNFGSIAGGTGDGVSIYSGSVINGNRHDSTALITSGSVGVSTGNSATVANYGTINGGSGGVSLGASSTLRNGSGADRTAGIFGNSGVGVSGYSGGIVANYGIISGTIGVSLANNGTVLNDGLIASTAGAAGTAVSLGTYGSAGRLIVTPNARFVGLVVGNTGAAGSTLELAGAPSVGNLAGLGSAFTNFSAIQIDAGARWNLNGLNVTAVTASLSGGAGSSLTVDGTFAALTGLQLADNGMIRVARTGVVEIGAAGGARQGAITVDAGHTLAGTATLIGRIVDNGDIAASGRMILLGPASGSGTATIDPFSVLGAAGSLSIRDIVFTGGGSETLALGRPARVTSTISGFDVPGNVIDLVRTRATSLNFANHFLTVEGPTGSVAHLHFAGNYTTSNFTLAADHRGGTDIVFTKTA